MSYLFKNIHKTAHFLRRCKMRGISEQIINELVYQYDEIFKDKITNNLIFIKKFKWTNKERNIILVTQIKEQDLFLITIHPLKENQKQNRIENGRWIQYE